MKDFPKPPQLENTDPYRDANALSTRFRTDLKVRKREKQQLQRRRDVSQALADSPSAWPLGAAPPRPPHAATQLLPPPPACAAHRPPTLPRSDSFRG